MKSLVVLLFFAGALHYFLHLPVVFVLLPALGLWLAWKLRWIILGLIGLDLLLGGGGGGGGDNGGGFI